jgi:hypothetical protein
MGVSRSPGRNSWPGPCESRGARTVGSCKRWPAHEVLPGGFVSERAFAARQLQDAPAGLLRAVFELRERRPVGLRPTGNGVGARHRSKGAAG